MTAADRIVLLGMLGVDVRLSADGNDYRLLGRGVVVGAVAPALHQHRTEIVHYLRGIAAHGVLGSVVAADACLFRGAAAG